MSLQFIMGNSGAGKSRYAYQKILAEAMRHPEKTYLIIVPEQFTMQTQKELVSLHPAGGILNVDILSFQRLAYRIFEPRQFVLFGLILFFALPFFQHRSKLCDFFFEKFNLFLQFILREFKSQTIKAVSKRHFA